MQAVLACEGRVGEWLFSHTPTLPVARRCRRAVSGRRCRLSPGRGVWERDSPRCCGSRVRRDRVGRESRVGRDILDRPATGQAPAGSRRPGRGGGV